MMANELNIAIQRPDEAAMNSGAAAMLEAARQIVISNEDQYHRAGVELQGIKKRAKELDEYRKSITAPLDKAKKSIMDLFRAPLEFLAEAETVIKRAMLTYQQAAEAKRIEEETRLREAEAARLAEERELAEAGLLDEAAIEPPKPIKAETPAPKAIGTSVREVWRAEVTDKKALIKYIADNPAWDYLVEPNMAEINGLAKIQKGRLAIPGLLATCEKIIVARGGI
ncbi:MAG: hypothetical protein HRF49_07735 [bacterium]|jgi:hypothetical protein